MNRQMLAKILTLSFGLLTAAVSSATVEGALSPSRVVFESNGIGTSGPVHIEGAVSAKGLDSLQVRAFGKTIDLAPGDLAQLSGRVINSISASYENAPRADGGRTVVVILGKVFASGLADAMVVAISESGHIRIHALQPQ